MQKNCEREAIEYFKCDPESMVVHEPLWKENDTSYTVGGEESDRPADHNVLGLLKATNIDFIGIKFRNSPLLLNIYIKRKELYNKIILFKKDVPITDYFIKKYQICAEQNGKTKNVVAIIIKNKILNLTN